MVSVTCFLHFSLYHYNYNIQLDYHCMTLMNLIINIVFDDKPRIGNIKSERRKKRFGGPYQKKSHEMVHLNFEMCIQIWKYFIFREGFETLNPHPVFATEKYYWYCKTYQFPEFQNYIDSLVNGDFTSYNICSLQKLNSNNICKLILFYRFVYQ